MGLEKVRVQENVGSETQGLSRATAAGLRRMPEKVSAGDLAAIKRQEVYDLKKAEMAVRGSFTRQEAIPVGGTHRETAQLIREAEKERMEELRMGNTDEVASAFLKSIGVETRRIPNPKTENKGTLGKILGFLKGLGNS